MGKSWDSSGIAFDKDMWSDLLRILKPGGHLLAFSGSRTYHRMAVAIEDAGFEIRDMIEWVYGSGFPKSLNIGKAVDKLNGASNRGHAISSGSKIHPTTGKPRANGELLPAYKARTEAGQLWEGYGTALKPAHEPCVLARKPLSEKSVAENCLKWGTGGINIDESRVETSDKLQVLHGSFTFSGGQGADMKGKTIEFIDSGLGRFPANLIHDGSDEVEAVFPSNKSTKTKAHDNRTNTGSSMFIDGVHNPENSYSDGGSASRFFYTAKANNRELS